MKLRNLMRALFIALLYPGAALADVSWSSLATIDLHRLKSSEALAEVMKRMTVEETNREKSCYYSSTVTVTGLRDDAMELLVSFDAKGPPSCMKYGEFWSSNLWSELAGEKHVKMGALAGRPAEDRGARARAEVQGLG